MSLQVQWVIWIDQHAGMQLVGVTAAQGDQRSRFCVIGRMNGEAYHLGFWVEIDSIQEWTIPDNIVVGEWTITPKTCLIPSSVISHVQLRNTDEPIGVTRSESKSRPALEGPPLLGPARE